MKSPPARLRLVLPLPPSINRQYATVGNRRVLTKDAREFKRELKTALIGFYFTFYFETPKRRDLDGGLKIALDAICVPLGIDDRSVVDLHLIKQIDPLKPRLEVELEAIHDWSFDPEFVLLDEQNERDVTQDQGEAE